MTALETNAGHGNEREQGSPSPSEDDQRGGSDGTDRREASTDRGPMLVLEYAVVLFAVVLLPVYVLFVVVVNAIRYGLTFPRTIWRRIVGKSIVQKQLEGRILAAKQDVLRIGLELYVESAGGDSFTPREVAGFKQVMNLDEASRGGRFEFWLPGRPLWRELFAKQFPPDEPTRTEGSTGEPTRTEGSSSGTARARRRLVDLVDFLSRKSAQPGESTRSKESDESDEPQGAERTSDESPGPEGPDEASPQARHLEELSELIQQVYGPTSFDVQGLPISTLWAFTAMELLNQASDSVRRNTETAYRAYLRAERMIVYGEYRLYELYRERSDDDSVPSASGDRSISVSASGLLGGIGGIYRRREESDPEAGPAPSGPGVASDPENPLRAYARSVLDDIYEFDGRELDVVRDLLCVEADDDDSEPELKDSISWTELDRAIAELNKVRMEQYRRLESLRVTILGFAGLPALLLGILLVFFPSVLADILVPPAAPMDSMAAATVASADSLAPVEVATVDPRIWIQEVSVTLFDWSATVSSEQLFFGLVLAFGALGAAISGTQKVEHDSGSLRALEQILGYWLALVRMVIGAISAFIVSIFLFSGIVDPALLSLAVVLGISLAAGFSERLALRAISTFEARTLPEVRGKRGGAA